MKRFKRALALAVSSVILAMTTMAFFAVAPAQALMCQGGGQCCAHTNDPDHPDACTPKPPPPPPCNPQVDPSCVLPPIYTN